ncbi:hypothetical protein EV356DRAFT_501058 [Viridothelium virens]|uniref:Protein kinase domain-containing protein n=1 Tax=Viridothelium virens TaxID=1048519 RepID=A0A6A6HAJ6_VIRVR|nr:hypothetical protein EV356DRAFT_501058 [Viridothelium virens]
MDAVSFGLAVFTCIGTLNDLMKKASDKVAAYTNASKEIPMLLKGVHHQCLKLRKDLEFLQHLKIEDTVDNTELIELQEDGLSKLERNAAKLARTLALNGRPSSREKLTYAFKYKPAVTKFHEEIQQWYARYSVSFYLLARVMAVHEYNTVGASQIMETVAGLKDARLRLLSKTMEKPEMLGSNGHEMDIPIRFTTATVSQNYAARQIVLDYVPAKFPEYAENARRDIQELASILSNFDPLSTGLLTCDHVAEVNVDDCQLFVLSFSFPPGLSQPCALRELLQRRPLKAIPINTRLVLATSLTTSVICMHAASFVHKNIRPETILIFDGPESTKNTFLIGFEFFRSNENQTQRRGDDSWTMAIYRHPKRQGLHPDSNYRMQHDIYSLGVCLLEIGLWECFVYYSFEDDDRGLPRDEVARPGDVFNVHPRSTPERPHELHARETKLRLENLARDRLPAYMGKKYTNVVLACLTCLEDPQFGRDLDNDNGLIIGTRFIKMVYQELQSISV